MFKGTTITWMLTIIRNSTAAMSEPKATTNPQGVFNNACNFCFFILSSPSELNPPCKSYTNSGCTVYKSNLNFYMDSEAELALLPKTENPLPESRTNLIGLQ